MLNADFWVNMQVPIGAEEPLQAQTLLVLAEMQGSEKASHALCLAYMSSNLCLVLCIIYPVLTLTSQLN
jgi:hypothetical protein